MSDRSTRASANVGDRASGERTLCAESPASFLGGFRQGSERADDGALVAATDQDQAAFLREAVVDLLALNPWLGSLVACDKFRVFHRKTGGEALILSADAPSSYGASADAILVDEVTHWRQGGGLLWHSLFSTAAKRKRCVLSIISNAGFGKGESWQWKVRESARVSGRWYFHQWPGPAEWLDAGLLAEQRDTLPPQVFQRLFENVWTSGTGDLVSEDWLRRAVVLSGGAAGGFRVCRRVGRWTEARGKGLRPRATLPPGGNRGSLEG